MKFGQKKLQPPARKPIGRANPYAYYSNRDVKPNVSMRHEPQKPAKTTSIKDNFSKAVVLPVIILGLVLLLDFLYLSSNPDVHLLNPNNLSTKLLQPISSYQSSFHKILNSTWSNDNKLTIDPAKLSSQIENQFPELANVKITLPTSGHQPTIFIQPADPVLRLNVNGQLFLINNAGKVLTSSSTPQNVIDSFAIYELTDNNLVSVKQGDQALSTGDINFIILVQDQLKQHQMSIKGATLVPNSRELDVALNSPNYYIKFNLQGDAEEQVGTYLALANYLRKQNITPAQYIDVRVDGRAYYK